MKPGDDENPDPRGPEHERTGEEPDPKPKPAPGPAVPTTPEVDHLPAATPDANPIDPRVF